MRMLVWKELRENFKWALLAMMVLGMAEVHALYETQYGYVDYYYNDGITLCKTSFLTVTMFGCPLVGFLLGLIQILPELKRDRWAALLHRPVPRGVIFRGKAVTGLLLYAIATVPPFLFAVWLAATPGHFGVPFVPEMVLPGTADICTGAVYYFAALAVTLQRGGWIGLRVFPLLAAVHASYFVLNEKLFYVSVEAAVLMALALFTAAWGAIHNQGLFRARPWLGRVAFLAAVFYGVCGLGDLTKSFFDVVGTSPHSKYIQYELSDEGVPLRLSYVDNVVVSVQDLDGKPLEGAKYKPDRVRNHLSYLNTFSSYVGDAHGWHRQKYQNSYRESRGYLWANGPYQYPRMEQWFYLEKSRTLVGYLPAQKAAFARFDRNGFQPVSARTEGFPPEVGMTYANQDSYCFWDPTNVRFAYLAKRKIVDLALPAPGPAYGVGYAWARNGSSSVDVTGVTLKTGLAVYDDDANLMTILPYHQDMDRWGYLSLGLNGAMDRFYLRYQPSAWIDDKIKKTMPEFVEEMDRQGRVLHSYVLPPLPGSRHQRSWDAFLTERLQSPAFFFGAMVYKKMGAELGSARLRGDLAAQFGRDRRWTKEFCVYIMLLSLLLAGITLFRARRVHFSWPRAWAWAGFVLAFNLAGFITFRLAADWPRFVPCHRCGKSRPTEAESCPHCGSGWPAPPATGIEIIERPPAEALTAASV